MSGGPISQDPNSLQGPGLAGGPAGSPQRVGAGSWDSSWENRGPGGGHSRTSRIQVLLCLPLAVAFGKPRDLSETQCSPLWDGYNETCQPHRLSRA